MAAQAGPYVDATPPPPPTDARPCHATDLLARPGEQIAGLGNTNFQVDLVVRARTACVLLGYPTLTGVAADGATTSIHTFHGSYFGDPGEPGITEPGQTAAVNISSGDACPALLSGRHRRYPVLRIGLPHGGGAIDVPSHGFDLECGVSVSRFAVPADQPYPQLQWLAASVDRPSQVRAGAIMRFVVRLHDTLAKAYPLSPCPVYQEGLYSPQARVVRYYRLNCATVHAIPPHGAVSFAMQLPVPAAMAGAVVKFDWELQDPFPDYVPASLGGIVTVLS